MVDLNLEGKLGIETISPVKDCCVESVLDWHPRTIGEKKRCLYCDNPMKTIRASEVADPEWTGMLNETKKERSASNFVASSLWFNKRKFKDEQTVQQWCADRGVSTDTIVEHDSAFSVAAEKIIPETERVVWANPGVVAVIGVQKMDTDSMATGGMLHPYQAADAKKKAEEAETEDTKEYEDGQAPENDKCVDKQMNSFDESLNKLFA